MKHKSGWAFPDADQFMLDEMHPDGRYQYNHLDAALGYISDFRVAVDGGAHVGTWTRVMADRFARVIAVEPSADTFEALCENVRAFGLANVEVKNVALGGAAGRVDMVLDGRAATLNNTGGRRIVEGSGTPMEAIDDWGLETLGFLKLDVEGSEVVALQGARKTLRRCRPIVLFENKGLWKRYGFDQRAPHGILTGLLYKPIVKIGCDEIWGPA
jgi:FkbM family methyltransferase